MVTNSLTTAGRLKICYYLRDLHGVALLLLPFSLVGQRELHRSQCSCDGAAEEHPATVRHHNLSEYNTTRIDRALNLKRKTLMKAVTHEKKYKNIKLLKNGMLH